MTSALRPMLWQVDAFARQRFAGNPAAVVHLPHWISSSDMQAIATENNLPETAFFVAGKTGHEIRWFTPSVEMPLCGHATLASGWVVLNRLERRWTAVTFQSRSGPLTVSRDGERLALDFPAITVEAVDSSLLDAALPRRPVALFRGYQWLAVYDSEDDVREMVPDRTVLIERGIHGLVTTAPGSDCDFVSRFFAPLDGIEEDPVTGASHSRLVPYWAARLGKTELHARQLSARGGELWCELRGDRVTLAGHVVPFLEGQLDLRPVRLQSRRGAAVASGDLAADAADQFGQ